MGLEQLGVLTVGALVAKEGGPPRCSLPKVITLGHVPCNTWSTRHSFAGWLKT